MNVFADLVEPDEQKDKGAEGEIHKYRAPCQISSKDLKYAVRVSIVKLVAHTQWFHTAGHRDWRTMKL